MTSGGGFTIIDFTVPTRDMPVIHPSAEAPICEDCKSMDLCFFDPTCSGCQDILANPKTSISELFAVVRQWVPQTQRHLSLLTREILRRGAHVNDKDGLTDLTLLHYACKAGAAGMGSSSMATNLVNSLVSKGADTDMRCHWTDMNALHYATFFDCREVVEFLAKHNPSLVATICSQVQGGNCLHIAAANLSLESAKILVKNNADGGLRDDKNRLPYECIPEVLKQKEQSVAEELRELLKEAANNRPAIRPSSRTTNKMKQDIDSSTSLISNKSQALLTSPRPPTMQATPNSPVEGATTPKISATSKASSARLAAPKGKEAREILPNKSSRVMPTIRQEPVPVSPSQSTTKLHVHTAVARQDSKGSRTSSSGHLPTSPSPVVPISSPAPSSTAISMASGSPDETSLETLGIKLGDRVLVDAGGPKQKRGTLRFCGETMFAPGLWAGVELDEELGKNDGSHGGIRYFSCKRKYGLFLALRRLSKDHGPVPAAQASGARGRKLNKDTKGKSESYVTARAIEAHGNVQMSHDLQVGYRVNVGKDMGNGTLRFVGTVKFAPGFWLGVELDRPTGNSDGSKGGREYFKCRMNHGVFVLPSKVTRLSERESVDMASTGSRSSVATPTASLTPTAARRRRQPVPAVETLKGSSSSSRVRGRSTAFHHSPVPSSLSLASTAELTLEKGMTVFVNKEKGAVQFIGTTDFAMGVWLGVELKKPTGKNDGSVNGKKYFSCRPLHGIFVRPEKATHRGINCAKLLKANGHS